MKATDSSPTFRDPVSGMQVKEDSTAGGKSAIYTCPMHPEVRQSGPGSCPKCGMPLEPVGVALEETGNPELAGMTRRFSRRSGAIERLEYDRTR